LAKSGQSAIVVADEQRRSGDRASELIETKIHDLGSRLGEYPHHRLRGRSEYRLRAGDYRIIYEFDQHQNTLHLISKRNSIVARKCSIISTCERGE